MNKQKTPTDNNDNNIDFGNIFSESEGVLDDSDINEPMDEVKNNTIFLLTLGRL